MGILDKLKGKAKSIGESAQERREHRSELKRIRTEARRGEEKSLTKFKVREDYRRKRQNIREGKGGILGTLSGIGDSLAGGSQGGGRRGPSLDSMILGDSGGLGGGDPLSDLILGKPAKPKTTRKKKRKKKKKTQPQVIVVIQEPKKKRRRRRKK